MNLHLGFGDDCQIKSTRLVYEYSKKLSDLPTFVTGDFNMRPTSIGYSTMTEKFTDVNTVTAKDMRPTYHGYHPETAPDLPIDFCFIDKKVTPISLKVIRETVDGKYPSDHFGLFCELNV